VTQHLCDTNVWLALVISGHTHHDVALKWLDRVDEPESILFCRATQQSFLRLLTNVATFARYGSPPLSNAQAWAVFDELLADYRVQSRVEEPDELERQWREFAIRSTASPKLWMDAYLAAFARTAGCRLVTIDSAFRQFEGLDLELLD
jgi:toxin-antitoxin system PIN domain toxin